MKDNFNIKRNIFNNVFIKVFAAMGNSNLLANYSKKELTR